MTVKKVVWQTSLAKTIETAEHKPRPVEGFRHSWTTTTPNFSSLPVRKDKKKKEINRWAKLN